RTLSAAAHSGITENGAILVGTLVIWAGSHFFGVGEIVDVALLLVGAAMIGPAVVDVGENLTKFGNCINAQARSDLETAAKAFAEAAVKGGLTVIMAVLLRRSAKGLQAARAPGVARPSWLRIAKPSGKFGLPSAGVDPHPHDVEQASNSCRSDAAGRHR